MRLGHWLWQALRGVLLVVAAAVVFIEEWGWRPLARAAARIARWPPLAALESRIARLPPRAALFLFLAPALLLFPLKLVALWLMNEGQVALGVGVIVVAKVVGTALVGRIFVLVERQLMQFAWFVVVMHWWQRTKARVKAGLHAWAPWRAVRGLSRRWRLWWRRRARS